MTFLIKKVNDDHFIIKDFKGTDVEVYDGIAAALEALKVKFKSVEKDKKV